MKRLISFVAVFCFMGSLAFAQPAVNIATIKGTIIDNQCAGAQKPEQLAEFVKSHTKQCALMAQCVASGYSIFSEGKLMKFDKDSDVKIAAFLMKADSKLQVEITTQKSGDILTLLSIKNQ
jgi:hypothetical protein